MSEEGSRWRLDATALQEAEALERVCDELYGELKGRCGEFSYLITGVRERLPPELPDDAFDTVLARILELCASGAPRILAGPQIVVLVHGIRDRASWYQVVSRIFEAEGMKVFGPKYGFFDPVRFLFPIDLSGGPRRELLTVLRDARANYPDSRISVIAHSFGSHLIASALAEESDIRLHRLIMCGAVVKQGFKWGLVAGRVGPIEDTDKRSYIVNDCGDADIWPALGRSAGWRYGDAGSFGFGNANVTNRFHEGDHGLFFEPEFIRKYWLPFVRDGEIVSGEGHQGRRLHGCLSRVALVPLRWLLLVSGLSVLGALGYGLTLVLPRVARWLAG